MNPEKQRHGCEQEVVVPSAEMLGGVDTDGSDHQSPDKIALGGEAHVSNVSPYGLAPDKAETPPSLLQDPIDGPPLTLRLALESQSRGSARFVTFHRRS